MNNFVQRTLTGAVFIGVVLGGIVWNEYACLFVFAVFTLLGMIECKNMANSETLRIQTGGALLTGLYPFFAVFFILKGIISPVWLILLVPMVLAIFIIELYRKTQSPLLNIALTLLIPVYVALPFTSLHWLAFYSGQYDYRLLLAFFVMIWVNDTGAYLAGRAFGKTRLFERISPKKSWEGAMGGFVATLLAAFVFSHIFIGFNLLFWIITGALVSVAGVFGDLAESMIKRSVNIKDSGSLLPGHGGVLDRFDGVLFAAPVACCCLIIMQFFFNS